MNQCLKLKTLEFNVWQRITHVYKLTLLLKLIKTGYFHQETKSRNRLHRLPRVVKQWANLLCKKYILLC